MQNCRAVTLVVALLTGCAAPQRTVPVYLRAADAESPRHPRSRFVTATASASSAQQADARAQAGVAQQISASIKVEIASWAQTSGAADAQNYVEKIKLNSSFAHGELVHIAERAQDDSGFYALAVLERGEAEAALARDVAADETRFAAAADRALAARRERKAGEFSTAAAEALAGLPVVEASYLLRRAVLRRPSAAESAHLARRNALLSALVDARSRRVVDIRVEGTPSKSLLQRAVSAVQRLGLRVAEGKGCSAQPNEAQADSTELVLSADETCGDGSFGPKCEVNVRLHARGCGGGGEGEGRIAQAKGAHTEDRERARAKAWEKITDALVEEAVKAALRGTLSAGAQ